MLSFIFSSKLLTFSVTMLFHCWNLHDDLFDEYKKWHKQDFASSHKTRHNSRFTKVNYTIKKATERVIILFWRGTKYTYFLSKVHIKNISFCLYHFVFIQTVVPHNIQYVELRHQWLYIINLMCNRARYGQTPQNYIGYGDPTCFHRLTMFSLKKKSELHVPTCYKV